MSVAVPETSLLVGILGQCIADELEGAGSGHCVRVDDIDHGLSVALVPTLASILSGVDVHILRASPVGVVEIAPERAIELRNRKVRPLLLLVPAGEGHAASSLDNSFERIPMLDIFRAAGERLLAEIDDVSVREALARLKRPYAADNRESWAEFVAAIRADPSIAVLGRELWRIGLVPDFGDDPAARLEANKIAAKRISRPTRPASSIDERLTAAGMQEGVWRGSLRQFLEENGPRLASPRAWAEDIGTMRLDLAFDRWVQADFVAADLEALEIAPFQRADGTLEKTCKLTLGADGQLILKVPDDSTAPVVVQWKTVPLKSEAVAKWRLEVTLPSDQRAEDTEPLITAVVNGSLRRSTVKVSADIDALAGGSRFVVVVTAVGEHGEDVLLTSGDVASAESQEFQIVLDEAPEPTARRRAAASVPEGVVRAVLDGQDDLEEDLPFWDLDGQIFGLRLGNRRAIQMRVSRPIIRLQRDANGRPLEAYHYGIAADYGTVIDEPKPIRELKLPNAFKKARAEFLSRLADAAPRDTAESISWSDEMREQAQQYLVTYKRALDQAEGESLQDLLLVDSASLAIRRNNNSVGGVLLLPTHPLRLSWIAEHDRILRSWADSATEVQPRTARRSQLSEELLAQVVPANLPFTVVDHERRVAVYAEELTHGAGLYIVPGSFDSDAAAESVCSVLGIERSGATITATARMVAERLAAYQAAHYPGGALRVLSINPGSGELPAAAFADGITAPPSDDLPDATDPRLLEVLCYTDSASYVQPVPALVELQTRLRARAYARRANHLSPPLSLSVRPASRLLEETTPAHLALLQDVGTPTAALDSGSDRRPSFNDLLVPLVTTPGDLNGDLVWASVPATGAGARTSESSIVTAHRSHQRAVARTVDPASSDVPSVRVVLDGDAQARINAAHDRADWVIGVDRFVGVNLFETGLSKPYILDYAPDFVEGIGERLTVTTTHRDEVERLLSDAMRELGLAEVDQSVGVVLDKLAVVSGRLALRLLENSTQAREAVSLAALISHLEMKRELDDLIVVPVDAHPEIFGPAGRDDGPARRCDLLLVRIGQRSLKIECVEVKSRKEAKLPQALADLVVQQLEDTQRVLRSRFFSDPPRIDEELQRARLVSLLHYYADRSANHGLIKADRIADIHRYIDRIEETGEPAEITARGFVISLDGAEGFKKRYGDIPLVVLTAADLGKLGFTTVLDQQSLPLNDPLTLDDVDHSGPQVVRASDPEVVSKTSESGEVEEVPEPRSSEPADPAAEPDSDVSIVRLETAHGSQVAAPAPQPGLDALDHEDDRSTREICVRLGEIHGGTPVTWRVSTKGSPHAFVIGIPGQGKSVTTRKIIRDFSHQGLPSIVFDFHGDMAADPPEGARVLNAAVGLPFNPLEPDVALGRPINTTAWEIAEVVGYVAQLGTIQQNHVYRALQKVYADHGWTGTEVGSSTPRLAEFAEALEEVEQGAAGKNARARLQPFTDFDLFDDRAEGQFEILTPEEHGWVIDISQLGLEEVQRCAASFILRRIYRQMFSWSQDSTLKLAVVLDEAHRMARDVTLPKIMKEGRKYGASVIVASQSLDDFHKDVVNNAGTKIVFRTNYPASKTVGALMRGRSGIDIASEIERLDVGSAYVSTPDSPTPRKVYMFE